MSGEVIRTRNFVADAAHFILGLANESLKQRGRFRIALSGGNTPRPIYREWARIGNNLPWDKILITFGDERCVPPDDEQSNYRMAQESLLDHVTIPVESVLRMRGEIEPRLAADEYENQLRERAGELQESVYRHDLVLLGMGDDGHTASLFPGTAALDVNDRAVVANFVPKFESWRLTMTYPVLNQARNVCFLINASKNHELIEHVIAGDTQYPAARVKPAAGGLVWFLGETA
jgi:6-phosphogluconolactonase